MPDLIDPADSSSDEESIDEAPLLGDYPSDTSSDSKENMDEWLEAQDGISFTASHSSEAEDASEQGNSETV